ncbi:hypothetical protein M2480_002690 [Parabacteroides sp. PFB2-12]|uniref:hypothetical protein n=1 Tax=unclassified Parabacteroides TaxID=2649774 RepID=UPI002474EAD8|nr:MULTISPECIES: hypothetical protein [unclassified Parabacteroides]MDH6343951.1 hypothetical protein [Parabacteroides sp. PM6-13]MDH6391688.1 hypothetical protein [Parabacteroides sp. PFB2-12]
MTPKRTYKATAKQEPIRLVKRYLKHLSFDELETVIGWAERYRKEKLGNEELQLIKQKEQLELKLRELKGIDEKINEF